ncbi:MAG: zinc-dependent metalloprotease [Chitinophagaceae bacterium]|nr:zinc-dependent metalloprotease [Chitinophagaceae bacterium]
MKQLSIFSLLLTALLFSGFQVRAQEECGFDDLHQRLLKEDSAFKKGVEEADRQWASFSRLIKTSGRQFSFLDDDVYEIPVVVHILHPGSPYGTKYNPTDEEVIDWIEYLNQVYSAEYPSYLPEGGGGVKIPVKFTLAKWDPDRQPTTGIERIDMSGDQVFVDNGVRLNSSGRTISEISKMFQWPKEIYYNIYITSKIDGADGYTGGQTAGFAVLGISNLLSAADGAYILEAYSRAGYPTLPHEIGHAFGLYHTWEGGSGTTCPPNVNCEEDGDKVCDTDPSKSLLGTCPAPSTINPCTGNPYGTNGVQHNFMNYTNCVRNHFTPGQAERMIFMLTNYRRGLLYSRALSETVPAPNPVPIPAVCNPSGVGYPDVDLGAGPVGVVLDSLMHFSSPYLASSNPVFYEDFTVSPINLVHTTLTAGTAYDLSVSTVNNQQRVKVYIDYNNDGAFTEDEAVMESFTTTPGSFTHTASIVPPETAVKNTALRMRVIADLYIPSYNLTPCGMMLGAGQVKDYSVTIIPAGVVFTGLTSFTGRVSGGNTAVLQWHIENTPLQVGKFELERSTDGQNFTQISTINRENGVKDYRYEDVIDNPAQRYYYRLKVLNGDRPEYSKVISLSFDTRNNFLVTVFPNPVTDIMTVRSYSPIKAIHVFDVYGRKVISRAEAGVINREVKLNFNKYPSGVYLIQVVDVNDGVSVKRVMKE